MESTRHSCLLMEIMKKCLPKHQMSQIYPQELCAYDNSYLLTRPSAEMLMRTSLCHSEPQPDFPMMACWHHLHLKPNFFMKWSDGHVIQIVVVNWFMLPEWPPLYLFFKCTLFFAGEKKRCCPCEVFPRVLLWLFANEVRDKAEEVP